MEENSNKPVVVEKSLTKIDGWLSYVTVTLGLGAVGYLWTFFMTISSLIRGVEGIDLATSIETLIFSLGLVFLFGLTLFLVVNRKKIAVLWAYITTGALALYLTIVSITSMFQTTKDCSYGGYDYSSYGSGIKNTCETTGLPAETIVSLIGAIFVAWAAALLIAYYFKKSERVAATLIK